MKWRWLIFAGFALLVLWLIWLVNKPTQPKLHEIRWEAPAHIDHITQCDLDGGKSDEVLVKSGGKWWWLRPSLEGWKATQLPIKVVVTNFAYEPLHFGILARNEKNALCFVYYRNGWQWQKLTDAPVNGLAWMDVDGDGKVNDVLVLKLQVLYWFHISDDGHVRLQDRQRVPQGYEFGGSLWSEQGKLVIKDGWSREEQPNLDWDGDGIPEALHYDFRICDKLVVFFSSTGRKHKIYFRNLGLGGKFIVTDLEGDGHRELAALAMVARRWKIVLINREGRWQPTPCEVNWIDKLWVTKMGRKEWLWAGASDNLWLLRHDGKGYQVRHWEFKGFPLEIWQDKRGTWFASYSIQSLYSHRWLAKVLDWLRSLRIPIRIPRAKIYLHLWRWDEKRDEWTQVERIRIPTKDVPSIPAFEIVDLNGDRELEWIVEVCPLIWSGPLSPEIWLFARELHLIGRIWKGNMLILRDKQRGWIVTVDARDPKILRGVTLVKGRGG